MTDALDFARYVSEQPSLWKFLATLGALLIAAVYGLWSLALAYGQPSWPLPRRRYGVSRLLQRYRDWRAWRAFTKGQTLPDLRPEAHAEQRLRQAATWTSKATKGFQRGSQVHGRPGGNSAA